MSTEAQSPPRPKAQAADWLIAVFCCLVVFATTLLSLAFLPWYWGSTVFPASCVLGGLVLFWAIRACYRLTGNMWAAASPLVLWFLLVAYLVFAPYLGSDVVPAYFGYRLVPTDWRTTVLLAIGVLVGAGVLGAIWGDHLAAKIRAERADDVRTAVSAGPLT